MSAVPESKTPEHDRVQVVVELTGDLDHLPSSTLFLLRQAVSRRPQAHFLVDLTHVTSVSATALDELARVHDLALAAGGSLVLHGARGSVRTLLLLGDLARLVLADLSAPDPVV